MLDHFALAFCSVIAVVANGIRITRISLFIEVNVDTYRTAMIGWNFLPILLIILPSAPIIETLENNKNFPVAAGIK
ncbi:unnamed protein product [Brugia timori]|uniref:Bm1217 n=2 Tax=Brugia TaxID=6278 RepID=A0A0J9XQT4_BRUMA|nr:Bm1217 [Brugia malayi]VDO23439.1 unnamed protein product [Brugia timori]